MFESLESRKLLAVSVSASGGVLTINGDSRANLINVSETAGAVQVETSTLPNGTITQQDFTGITAIRINGGGDNDVIFYDGDTVGADIHGDNAGNGSDKRNSRGGNNGWNGGSSGGSGHNGQGGSSGGSNNGNGGKKAGNDQITVTDDGAGSSTVDGDGGADVLTIIDGNNTQAFGGDGNDQFFIQTSGDPSGSTAAFGEAGSDTFTVYEGTNTINGGAGNDIVFENGGNNTIISATVQ